MTTGVEIICGRSEEAMLGIEPGTVSLSFWSPPYYVGKEYEEGETYDSWQEMLRCVIQRHATVLKPGGFMVINIADILCFEDPAIPKFQAKNVSNHRCKVTREMVLEAKKKFPEYNRYKLAEHLGCSEQTIDRRLNGNNIRGGKHANQTRVKLVGGCLEEYAYDAGIYLYDKRVWVKDPSWANSKWTTSTLKAVSEHEDLYVFWKPGEYEVDRDRLTKAEWKEWGLRGVWYIKSVRRNDLHEAMFPIELAERVIRLFSAKGDLVLDPFLGSGTTALAALQNGRDFIGIDKEANFCELARRRIEEQRRKA
jgi:site-specific DNA-methyltransferase (adenine-specific)